MNKILILSTLFLFILPGCSPSEDEFRAEKPPEVEWMEAREEGPLMSHIFPGIVEPPSETFLSFRVSGPVQDIPVKKGELIQEGELLARMDTRDYENKLKEIEHSLESLLIKLEIMEKGAREEDIAIIEAKLQASRAAEEEAFLEYQRYKNLLERQAVPRATYDKIEAHYIARKAEKNALKKELEIARSGAREEDIRAMKAQIEAVRTQRQHAANALSDTQILAPYTGYVGDTMVEKNQLVQAGQPVLSFWKEGEIEVRVSLPENFITLELEKFYCRFPRLSEETYPAKIKELGRKPQVTNRSFPLILTPDPKTPNMLLPGMTAEVRIDYHLPGVESWFSIPLQALFSDHDEQSFIYVYNKEDELLESREVKTGALLGEKNVQVKSGLEEGEIIILSGVRFLKPGQRVTLKNTPGEKGAPDETS